MPRDIFEPDWKYSRKWGGPFAMNISGSRAGWFNVATGVEVGPDGYIYVADFYNNRIQKFSPKGKLLTVIGTEGNGAGQLKYPTDMALDDAGNVYVVDFGNNRIQKFSPKRKLRP